MRDEFNSVINGYSTSKALDAYSITGLWASESDLVKNHFREGSRILDLGCGAGRTTIPLTLMGYEVIGVDINETLIRIAGSQSVKHELNPHLMLGSANALSFKDESFNGVLFSFNGIEHLTPPEALNALREVNRVLKKGGCFIFTAHSILCPGFIGEYWMMWLLKSIKVFFSKLLRIKIKERYYGDTYWINYGKPMYTHHSTINRYKKALSSMGFRGVTVITEKKVLNHNRPSIFDNFARGNIFFIAWKA